MDAASSWKDIAFQLTTDEAIRNRDCFNLRFNLKFNLKFEESLVRALDIFESVILRKFCRLFQGSCERRDSSTFYYFLRSKSRWFLILSFVAFRYLERSRVSLRDFRSCIPFLARRGL